MGFGNTVPVLVSFKNITLEHQSVVIDIEEGIDCYICDDIINLFSITASNILINALKGDSVMMVSRSGSSTKLKRIPLTEAPLL